MTSSCKDTEAQPLCLCQLKNAQCESCELSNNIIWGKMRSIAQETASQKALRNFSKEVGGRSVLYISIMKGDTCSEARILAEGCCLSRGADVSVNDFSAFLDMRRYKNLDLKNLLKIFNYLKICSASFSQSTACLIPDLHPEFFSGCVEGQRLQWLATSSL